MKKAKFATKLSLNKETVSKLNNDQMTNINGGEDAALSYKNCLSIWGYICKFEDGIKTSVYSCVPSTK